MNFCPKCDNIFSIMKMNEKQVISMTTPDDVSISETSTDTKTTASGSIISKSHTENKNTIYKAYFYCNSCNYTDAIKEGTLILSRISSETKNEYYDKTKYKDMMYDNSMPHTRNYICINKSCETHKDIRKKDAIWFKPSKNSYAIVMICTVCQTIF